MKRLITILALAALACGVSTAGMTPAVPASPTTTSAPPRTAPKPTNTTQPKRYEVYRAGYLYVRAGAGTSHEALAALRDGDVVILLEKNGQWWQIKTQGDTVGWVNSYYLRAK